MDHSPPGSSVHGILTERSHSTQLVTATKEGRVGRNGEDATLSNLLSALAGRLAALTSVPRSTEGGSVLTFVSKIPSNF